MDSNIKLLLERAENELDLAKVIFTTTENKNIQTEVFHLNKVQTFYSSVISHSYYCIFYSAKTYLLTKGIRTEAPEVHKKKRGEFTYQKIAQAYRDPANQSLENAKTVFSNIFRICSKEE